MDGMNVVVIGGTSGIGLATAISSAQRGATVFAAGRSLDKIEACQASYPDIQFRQVDTHDPEGLSALFSEAGPIHHLVGAATGATRTNGPFMSQTDEQFRAAFDKFWGYTHVVRQGVPHLVRGCLHHARLWNASKKV